MCWKHLVSSANRKKFTGNDSVWKVIHVQINRKGPRILPCGTPDSTGRRQE